MPTAEAQDPAAKAGEEPQNWYLFDTLLQIFDIFNLLESYQILLLRFFS